MNTKIKIYIAVFILIVGGIVYADYTKEKPINWFPSFTAKDKIPYGTYVLKKELPTLFPKTKIKEIHTPPYLFLKDTTQRGTYFFVDAAINFDKQTFYRLLDFVARGNTVFISTNGAKIDTLKIASAVFFGTDLKEKTAVSLVNPKFKSKEYQLEKSLGDFAFKKLDTLKTTVLGSILLKDVNHQTQKKGVNFIEYKFGKGNIFIHLYPIAFTNYGILEDQNYEYVANVLSYIDETKPILWDAYYKTGKSKITSPMYYILNNKNLKWAYYMLLIGVLFFILFKGKREQRMVPILTSLKNQTLAFTRTIANMYYEKSPHKEIATLKIQYFLEYLRNTYRISTTMINDSFIEHIALRSGNTKEEVHQLFEKITKIEKKAVITQQELIDLNTQIEAFKNKK